MIQIRRSQERGHAEHGWLSSRHTFSFADYYDPEFMGFRVLRVINEDYIQGGMGFPTHPHRDMEIITYVVDGELAHKDTLGSSSVIRPGEVQYMCAGTGVQHSEFNASKDHTTHLLQIWILPSRRGFPPSYAQKDFSENLKNGELVLTVSPDGRAGSIAIHQDMDLYAARWSAGQEATLSLRHPHAWVQVVSGDLEVGNQTLKAGDGAAVAAEKELRLVTKNSSEFLIFDLP